MELKQFKIAVLPLRSKLLNYARRLTDDPDDAEDAVQETMLRLWNRRAELEQYRSIEAFAMTLVHNLCMDLWRTRRNEYVSLDNVSNSTSEATPEQLLELPCLLFHMRGCHACQNGDHHHADERHRRV